MLLEQKTTDFLEQLSSSAPIPGGGGASAAVGAFASALGLMVTNLTVGKKKYADVEEEILEIREKLEQKKQDLVRMVDEDAEAFEPLAKAYRMPKETEEEKAEKARDKFNSITGETSFKPNWWTWDNRQNIQKKRGLNGMPPTTFDLGYGS